MLALQQAFELDFVVSWSASSRKILSCVFKRQQEVSPLVAGQGASVDAHGGEEKGRDCKSMRRACW